MFKGVWNYILNTSKCGLEGQLIFCLNNCQVPHNNRGKKKCLFAILKEPKKKNKKI